MYELDLWRAGLFICWFLLYNFLNVYILYIKYSFLMLHVFYLKIKAWLNLMTQEKSLKNKNVHIFIPASHDLTNYQKVPGLKSTALVYVSFSFKSKQCVASLSSQEIVPGEGDKQTNKEALGTISKIGIWSMFSMHRTIDVLKRQGAFQESPRMIAYQTYLRTILKRFKPKKWSVFLRGSGRLALGAA